MSGEWSPFRRWWPWIGVSGALATGAGVYVASGDPRLVAVGSSIAAATAYILYRKFETDRMHK